MRCGRPFVVTGRSLVWLRAKDWPAPRRCSECREARRMSPDSIT
jgi:hypothetical protein